MQYPEEIVEVVALGIDQEILGVKNRDTGRVDSPGIRGRLMSGNPPTIIRDSALSIVSKMNSLNEKLPPLKKSLPRNVIIAFDSIKKECAKLAELMNNQLDGPFKDSEEVRDLDKALPITERIVALFTSVKQDFRNTLPGYMKNFKDFVF